MTVGIANLVAVIVVVATIVAPVSTANIYIVGDSLGWNVPPDGVAMYSDWASQHKFMAGDILVFNFTSGHSVATVSIDDFDACNTDRALNVKFNGPVNYTLDAGDTYFICLVDDHCVQGQQLAITASSTGSPTRSLSPKSSPGGNTPPPPVQGSSTIRKAIANSFLMIPLFLVTVPTFVSICT